MLYSLVLGELGRCVGLCQNVSWHGVELTILLKLCPPLRTLRIFVVVICTIPNLFTRVGT